MKTGSTTDKSNSSTTVEGYEDRLPRMSFSTTDKEFIYSAYIAMEHIAKDYDKKKVEGIVASAMKGCNLKMTISKTTCFVSDIFKRQMELSRLQGIFKRLKGDKSLNISLKKAFENLAKLFGKGHTLGTGDITRTIEKDPKLAADFKRRAENVAISTLTSSSQAIGSESEADEVDENSEEKTASEADESSEEIITKRGVKRKFDLVSEQSDETDDNLLTDDNLKTNKNQELTNLYLTAEEKRIICSPYVIIPEIEDKLNDEDKANIEFVRKSDKNKVKKGPLHYNVKGFAFPHEKEITLCRLKSISQSVAKEGKKISIKEAFENLTNLYSNGLTIGNKAVKKGIVVEIKKNEVLAARLEKLSQEIIGGTSVTNTNGSDSKESNEVSSSTQKLDSMEIEIPIEPKDQQPQLPQTQTPQSVLSDINIVTNITNITTSVIKNIDKELDPKRVINRITIRLKKVVKNNLKEKDLEWVADNRIDRVEEAKDIWYKHLHDEYNKLHPIDIDKPEEQEPLIWCVEDEFQSNGNSFKKFDWNSVARGLSSETNVVTPEQAEESYEKMTYETTNKK